MASSSFSPPPEVTDLLERFQVKKATVKTRLNDIVDDLFGDFLSEVARIASAGPCPKCSAAGAKSPDASSSSEAASNQPPQTKASPPSSSHHQNYLESTIRSAQARARDLIKEEFYDSDAVARLAAARNQRRSSLLEVADEEAPEITLTPIDTRLSSAAALASVSMSSPLSSKEEVASLNGNNNNTNSQDESHHETKNGLTHASVIDAQQRPTYDSDEEESIGGDDRSSVAAAALVNEDVEVKSEENGHQEDEEEMEEDEENEMGAKGKGQSSETMDIGEKSLEELNTLCNGLPYDKHGGKYICQFQNCGQELKSRHNLLLHQRAHLGIRPYRCKWPACSYNSNQSSAVIRHIRTKHFLLPLTMREQQMKKIEDDRDPKEYLEVMAADATTTTSSAATPEQGPGSMEPSSDSLQSCPDVLSETSLNMPTLRSSTKANGKGRKLVPSGQSQQQQSLLMPQQNPQHTNGKSAHAAHPSTTEESDEDEYDSDENEFEVIPMRSQLQRAAAQQQQQLALQNAYLLQQQLAAQQQHQAQLNSKSPFDYARKRRLESKIFANANVSRGYYGNGPMKRAKSVSAVYGGGSGGDPHASSSARGSSLGGGQHQYSFCPEENCSSVFRTKNELDRHLTDVHCRLPQPKINTGPPPNGPPKEPQTYSNLYICRWPKCPFSTVLHSSAINHVRGKHFNIPRTMTAQQRKLYAHDTRNPNDYIKLLPFAK